MEFDPIMQGSQESVGVAELTAAAFAPFGDIIEHDGKSRRCHVGNAFTAVEPAVTPSLWISRFAQAIELPIRIERMERHPYSTQTFVPLAGVRYLIVVARDDGHGRPDPAAMQAFVADAGQGITYARNVWHAGMLVLDAPADFVVAMTRTGRGDDDEFVPLPYAVSIGWSAEASLSL